MKTLFLHHPAVTFIACFISSVLSHYITQKRSDSTQNMVGSYKMLKFVQWLGVLKCVFRIAPWKKNITIITHDFVRKKSKRIILIYFDPKLQKTCRFHRKNIFWWFFCQLNKKQKWGSSVLLISLSQKAGAMKKAVLALSSSFTAFSLT